MFTATSKTAQVKRAEYDGREWLTCPVVMLVEGQVNGAIIQAVELAKSAPSWNGRPVTVLHPRDGDQPISANSPAIMDQWAVGQVFDVHEADGKLKGVLWVDIQKAVKLGFEDLLKDLQAEKMMEVSTGYFADEVEGAHVNIRPDHLAILPGEVGACSIADGCGTPRTNNTDNTNHGGDDMPKTVEEKPCVACEKLQDLHTNGKISEEQHEILKGFFEALGIEKYEALIEVVEALATVEAVEEPEAVEAQEDDFEARVQEAAKRLDVERRFQANSKVSLTDTQIKATPIDVLENLIGEPAPVINYAHKAGFDTIKTIKPLLPSGVFGRNK